MSPKATYANRFEWFPLYHSDWLNDDKLTLSGLAAQGLLMRLMCKTWKHGGTITVDDEELQMLSCGNVELMKEALATLVRRNRITMDVEESEDVQSYTITIPRLVEVYEEQMARHEAASSNGRKGALKRYSTPEPVEITPEPSQPVQHKPSKSEVAILEQHGHGEVPSVLPTVKVDAVVHALDALAHTGKPLGLAMNTGLKRRWATVLLEVFTTASNELHCSLDEASESFILRLRDNDVRDNLKNTTWVRPEYLKTDWPQYVRTDLSSTHEFAENEMQKRITKFYGGIALMERDHEPIDPEHKAKIVTRFWKNLAQEFNLNEDKARELEDDYTRRTQS